MQLNEFVGKIITEFTLADDAVLGREVAVSTMERISPSHFAPSLSAR